MKEDARAAGAGLDEQTRVEKSLDELNLTPISELQLEAVPGESGYFARVQYHIDTEFDENVDEKQVYINLDLSSEAPVYVYTPVEKVSLVRYVLEKSKINYVVNDYGLSTNVANKKTICHYYTSKMSTFQKEFLVKQLKYGARVTALVDELENRFDFTEVALLDSDFYLHQKSFSVLRERSHTVPKRIIDVLFVLLLMPVAIPLGVLASILIKLESKGPILFRQKRTGLYNKEYEVIKFRSMAKDAEKSGAAWATKNDARVTRVGKVIRKTRIDELPQLINVWKGEMSMIGPRPEREVFIDQLEKEIPYYRFRHSVRPGITGHAQVEYPYGASVEDAVWKHKYDMFYIKNQSLWLDIKILAKTVTTVLFGKGQ